MTNFFFGVTRGSGFKEDGRIASPLLSTHGTQEGRTSGRRTRLTPRSTHPTDASEIGIRSSRPALWTSAAGDGFWGGIRCRAIDWG
jgi:hypothetical protein